MAERVVVVVMMVRQKLHLEAKAATTRRDGNARRGFLSQASKQEKDEEGSPYRVFG
jgi:hypothetical protein